jgi:predicted  nucleic acid-binding Zn-ribbon protein
MRFQVFILIAVLFASGCASKRPIPTAKQISEKRDEVEVLQEEIDQNIRQLDHLQRDLASKDNYSTEAQARDLDHFILVLHQTKVGLITEYKQLHNEYHVWDGPY